MIIRDEDELIKDRAGPGHVVTAPEEAPPPQYEELDFSTPQTQSEPTSSASHQRSPTRSSTRSSSQYSTQEQPPSVSPAILSPVDSRAVNYISINKPLGSIDCTYLLDPTVQIPASFLPKLEKGETEEDRKNLSLKTKVGTIVANVMLHHREGSVPTRRTNLEFKTSVGTMVLKIDATPSPNRPPFQLKAVSQSGTILLHLPRTFRGFLTIITTIGSVTLAPEVHVANRWISTSTVGRFRKGFLGDSSTLGNAELETWNGDEVIIETTVGSVEIHYVSPGSSPISFASAITDSSFMAARRSASAAVAASRASVRAATALAAPPPLAALLGYHNRIPGPGGGGG